MARKHRIWFNRIRRKFAGRSPVSKPSSLATTDDEFRNLRSSNSNIVNLAEEEEKGELQVVSYSKEELAAIKIQAFFRGHLARQALKGLKRVVKLQAVVRGMCVRRQARIAMHCMNTLVRLQVRVRARQLLTTTPQYP
ncbi:hypothetical protein AMTRI_Chr09g15070 [Amborella trichopoda]